MLEQHRNYRHSNDSPIGVLLVNLGSPEAPTAKALAPYLRQFLSDRRVVEAPRWLWQLILNLIIIPTRSPKSAAAYASVWEEEGAPLILISRRQQLLLAQLLGDDYRVELAMSYGKPSIGSALLALREQGCESLVVLPMYPQYASATVGSVFTDVVKELSTWRWTPALNFITNYYRHPLYIDALAQSIRAHQEQHGTADKLLFSFHGTPLISLFQGDPYHCQCRVTARLVAQNLSLSDTAWQLSFQSRFGKLEWLQPYTDASLEALAKSGIASVQVVCPGFSADCLETLEEIAEENKEIFLKAGGKKFSYIPALNDSEAHIELLQQLVRSHSAQWLDSRRQPNPADFESVPELRSNYHKLLSSKEQRLADSLNNAQQ